jgi:hypothetical protein
MAPTFIPFTPWTTTEGYCNLLRVIAELDLIDNVAPVQLSLRLLVPSNSRLLELADIQAVLTGFDAASLSHRWKHPDSRVDELARKVMEIVHDGTKQRLPRRQVFEAIWNAVQQRGFHEPLGLTPRTIIPYMEEPWFC